MHFFHIFKFETVELVFCPLDVTYGTVAETFLARPALSPGFCTIPTAPEDGVVDRHPKITHHRDLNYRNGYERTEVFDIGVRLEARRRFAPC